MFYFSSSVPPFGGPWWFFGSWLIQCVLSHFAFTQISCWYHHSSELPFDRYHHHSSHPLFNISFSNFSFSIKSSTHKSAHVYHLRTNYITKICSHWLWQKNGKPDVSIPSSTSTGIISSWTNKGAPPHPTYQTIAQNEEQPLWQKIIWLFYLECTTL